MKTAYIYACTVLITLGISGCGARAPSQTSLPTQDANTAIINPAKDAETRSITEPQHILQVFVPVDEESARFELPIEGASAYAAMNLALFTAADITSDAITILAAGQGFTILKESGGWWFIELGTIRGWIENRYCMINLPDIIPSIVYYNTNTFSSLFKSSYKDIPNVTGTTLYQSRDFNARLNRDEYIAAVLYGMAGKIAAAQQAALAEGNTLVIYEAFRPAEAHNIVHENLLHLYNTDPVVRTGISTAPWNIRWFLAESPYNHQRGTAIDVSLARIDGEELLSAGDFTYRYISECTEFTMQTPMHEMSIASVVFTTPAHARSETAWKDAEFSPHATAGTILLHQYATSGGLIPLASEWWHFNDLEYTALAVEADFTGEFHIDRTYSKIPVRGSIR